jgi:TPP-dependent pyruvate/acetoin dehydrogenase alpha subunit
MHIADFSCGDDAVQKELEAAVEFARQSPSPSAEEAMEDVGA